MLEEGVELNGHYGKAETRVTAASISQLKTRRLFTLPKEPPPIRSLCVGQKPKKKRGGLLTNGGQLPRSLGHCCRSLQCPSISRKQQRVSRKTRSRKPSCAVRTQKNISRKSVRSRKPGPITFTCIRSAKIRKDSFDSTNVKYYPNSERDLGERLEGNRHTNRPFG